MSYDDCPFAFVLHTGLEGFCPQNVATIGLLSATAACGFGGPGALHRACLRGHFGTLHSVQRSLHPDEGMSLPGNQPGPG